MRPIKILFAALLALTGCVFRKAQPSEDYPAPHFHDYPEIPPDTEEATKTPAPSNAGMVAEVSDAAAVASAKAAVDMTCNLVSPPERPVATPLGRRIYSGPPITNRIAPEVIMRPVRRRLGCFRGCVAQSPAGLSGRVVTEFVVEEDGWVRLARPKDNGTGDKALGECMARQFIGLEFPPPHARITVMYPFQVGEPRP
jgi:hypothetical protein